MNKYASSRREFIKSVGLGATALAMPSGHDKELGSLLAVNPEPQFDLSPYLYMQFMEPLGATDGSVEAAWDHLQNDWREHVVAVTRELAPTMLRWGGIFTDYYRWREGVGPREDRPMMRNLLWGGVESNQVGTAEFVDFARRVGAEPLFCVNFESDGRDRYKHDGFSVRNADAKEAAEWVSYCNDPTNTERQGHKHAAPLQVGFWQIGNETSYSSDGFRLEEAKRKTVEFAKVMRRTDPTIKLIGWGGEDHGSRRRNETTKNWTRGMAEAAGEYLDYLAFHHMYNPDNPKNPAIEFTKYRKDPARTWDVLMNAWKAHDQKIREAKERLGGLQIPLAMTECHFSIPGRNRCEVMSSWACGVAYARLLNVHERHGDVLKIATAADFCGTRWQVNAVMIYPRGRGDAFLMPVAHVMKLYRHHSGDKAVTVKCAPEGLDVTASRTGNRLFLHVVNTNRKRAVTAQIVVGKSLPTDGRVFEITADPMVEIHRQSHTVLQPMEKRLPADCAWEFPAASVSAVELNVQKI